MKDVISYLKGRGVEHLVHFTPITNLERIKLEGIVPRSVLDGSGNDDYKALDELRLDGRREYSCFSISFPNYRMMSRYRITLREEGTDVALLFFNIEILGDFESDHVLFFPSNAASRECQQGDLSDRMGLEGVKRLFEDDAVTASGENFNRSDVKLPQFLTTNPQAEVQVRGEISWDKVKIAVVDGWDKKQELIDKDLGVSVYAKWQLERDEKLNVFQFPEVWRPWHRKVM